MKSGLKALSKRKMTQLPLKVNKTVFELEHSRENSHEMLTCLELSSAVTLPSFSPLLVGRG
jgi:hypothetical protein